MLHFDASHKSVNEDINKRKGINVFKKAVALGLIAVNLITFSACAKTMPCDIEGDHAHYYYNNDELGRYIMSEKSTVSGLERSEEAIPVSVEEMQLLEFMNKKDLFSIEDNKEAIQNITSKQQDYQEYRYSYHYLQPIPIVHSNGKTSYVSYIYVPRTGYSWTTDQTRNLTGEERTCHYVYYGYKIEQKENGKYELIKSEAVDDINDLPSGYKYIKEDFYDVVNLNDRTQELDYEDVEGDKEIISEEEYNKAQAEAMANGIDEAEFVDEGMQR